MRSVCVHGHFYQPSRVNPWTDRIAPQPSAAPYRDWNHRITAECYAPNVAARLLDDEGVTRAVRNTYRDISFNFGPTLLAWLEREAPAVLAGIRRADEDARQRYGHGAAIAQPYHHPILPLCDDRDRRTEVLWGLDFFKRVFHRPAKGMWLSETAVDTPTLETLSEAGVQFVILAPHQIASICDSEGHWQPVSNDTQASRAFVIPLPSGREIIAAVYDGSLSLAVAFDGLLHDGGVFAQRLIDGSERTGFTLIATDGESYGHHHKRGEMALAYALEQIEQRDDVQLTNLAAWLAENPPQEKARLAEPSSWSCAHGVGRWSEDCGCKISPDRDWHQRWRAPYRALLERLRDQARDALSPLGRALFADPVLAREAYGQVMGRPERFAAWYTDKAGAESDPVRARQWLECQRNLLAMFTSCAWFFDEVTGIEPEQNLRHAGGVVGMVRDLTGVDLSDVLEADVLALPSNRDVSTLLPVVRDTQSAPSKPPSAVASVGFGVRQAGVLQPVSALPGQGPIGDLDAAQGFVDWLADAGVGVWQILPLVPTDGYGSPYSSDSALSGNPDLVGLEFCISAGLLDASVRLETTAQTDYAAVWREKRPLILRAAQALLDSPDHPWRLGLDRFEREAQWARDAAIFRAIKLARDGEAWWEWPESLRRCEPEAVAAAAAEHESTVRQWCAALYLFERQWGDVRSYAAGRGIRLMGDMPIYVGRDSADVWMNQPLFQLDDQGIPTAVAGVPPDAYSDTGQLWGNPLFDWETMETRDWSWWAARCRRMLEHCDSLRIDHFIAFDRYWSVPTGADDARAGAWNQGPGQAFFDGLGRSLGSLPLIAEDLGDVAESTHELRDAVGLPGMRVAVFGYDGNPENMHHPSQYPEHTLAYSSTHDSPPIRGWLEEQTEEALSLAGLEGEPREVAQRLVDGTLKSASSWAVLPIQDVLGLGLEARMNKPGTSGGNWTWRVSAADLTRERALELRARIEQSGRLRN